MTIDVLNIQYYKTAVYIANYSILPSSCCLCTKNHYITILIGSSLCVVCCYFELQEENTEN